MSSLKDGIYTLTGHRIKFYLEMIPSSMNISIITMQGKHYNTAYISFNLKHMLLDELLNLNY